MYPGLSLDQAPPILVPFRFFLSAPLFGVLACLFSLYIGSDMLESRWLPSVIAVAHLITLGIISMVMLGALFQMLPVVAGAAIIAQTRISTAVHLLIVIGTLLLTWGLYQGSKTPIEFGIYSLGCGFLFFIVAASHALLRAPRNHDSVRGMRLAVIFGLSVTIMLGLTLAAGHAWDSVTLWRTALTYHHVLWGTVAWVSLLVGVIAYQVVPMFQMTPEYPPRFRQYWSRAVFFLLLLSGITGIFQPDLTLLISILIAMGLLVFASITLNLQRQRKRRLPDVTLNFWRLGMLALIASISIFMLDFVWPQPYFELLIGCLFFMGFALSVINGMLYKIVPFLVWLHLQNQLLATMQLGKMRIPNMKQVIPNQLTKRQFWLHLSALFFLVVAIIFRDPWFSIAWGLFLLSFLLLGYNLLIAYRCYLKEHRRISIKGAEPNKETR